MQDLIERQAAIDAVLDRMNIEKYGRNAKPEEIRWTLEKLPSVQPEIAENLYLYKCYITDKDGLQHEVIHTGDIRRVTGWEI